MDYRTCWRIFTELLMQNGEPFGLEPFGEVVCLVKKEGRALKIAIRMELIKGEIIIEEREKGKSQRFAFNPNDEEAFSETAEVVIKEINDMYGGQTQKQVISFVQHGKLVRRGDVFHIRANAELLNELFWGDRKSYMKCYYKIKDDHILIIHEFGKITHAGWLNTVQPNGDIIEQFMDGSMVYKSHAAIPQERYRSWFKKDTRTGTMTFLGVYSPDKGNTGTYRRWIKVRDEMYF